MEESGGVILEYVKWGGRERGRAGLGEGGCLAIRFFYGVGMDIPSAFLVLTAHTAEIPSGGPQLLALFAKPAAEVLKDGRGHRVHGGEVCAFEVCDKGFD